MAKDPRFPTREDYIEQLVKLYGVEKQFLEGVAWDLFINYSELASEGGRMMIVKNGSPLKVKIKVADLENLKRLILEKMTNLDLKTKVEKGVFETIVLLIEKIDPTKPIELALIKPPSKKIRGFKPFEEDD